MKFLKALCVLAIALCLTASVYAETQSVKVSGDLAVRGLFRSSYDYRGATPEPDIFRTGMTADTTDVSGNAVPGTPQSWAMSTTEVQVDADLTDNVSTCIRILNERDWGVRTKNIAYALVAGVPAGPTGLPPNGNGGYAANAEDFNINLDLAYVTLKNFIYSPLTVTIGRQDLWLGKGFIVGSNHLMNNLAYGRGLTAPEYTSLTAFDSVKAVLDYDPWTITGIYSTIWNNTVATNDDVDLWGVNVGYKFDAYKAEAEAYWFFKRDHQVEKWGGNKGTNDVHTLGLRGSLDPLDVLTVAAEGAWQGGSYIGTRLQQNERDRSAFALDISGEWRYWTDKFAWKPKVGVEYILYSGEKDTSNQNIASGTYEGWDPMFRGKFDSSIREFVGSYYASYDYQPRADYLVTCADASFTNQNQVMFTGSLQPIESLTLKGNYNLFWVYHQYLGTDGLYRGDFVGQEVDLQAIWDYTEDVSFGLLGAFFVPGDGVYGKNRTNAAGRTFGTADKVATDIVGTVKVSF